ncbi:hypothetical protein [Streptomyces sp. NPDC058305]|uniref:hypothetical protein n=1 Tax=Streptomyces sp. NPDC058305 TaxID=3346438 RepID=UPI0036E79F56
MVHATPEGHVLHQFPYAETASAREGEGEAATVGIEWKAPPAPQEGGDLAAPVRAAVDYAFTPMDMDHPNPFGVTVVLMEEDGYTVRLTKSLDR